MGIYIPDMEMPTEYPLWIVISPDGTVQFNRFAEWETAAEKAVPVPPHGDSIDRAALWVEINKICDRRDAGIISDLTCLQQILSALRHAPTIIPAEEDET